MDFKHHFLTSLGRVLAILIGRHWITACANTTLTVLGGLGILAVIRRLRLAPTSVLLHLRYAVLAWALVRGTFYMIMGETLLPRKPLRYLLEGGLQIPAPRETFGFASQTRFSIWHSASLAGWVALALFLICGAALLSRLYQVLFACRKLDLYAQIAPAPGERVHRVMALALESLDLSRAHRAPRLLIENFPMPTPLLIGIFHPRILLRSELADIFTDRHLELTLRHELAHFKRRDHWFRWFLVWLSHIAQVNPWTNWLFGKLVDLEELLCDRMAVQSPQDADDLAEAIIIAVRYYNEQRAAGGDDYGIPSTLPTLLGKQSGSIRMASIVERLKQLEALAIEFRTARETPAEQTRHGSLVPRVAQRLGHFLALCLRWFMLALLSLILFLFLYMKAHVYVQIPHLYH